MQDNPGKIEVAMEIGKKRTFASAINWPGWSRSGGDEEAALNNLLVYGIRYAKVLKFSGPKFHAPQAVSAFDVVERFEGNSTTDFGAPGIAPSADNDPVDSAELERLQMLLNAYWQTFDRALQQAKGKELQKGPRGGGRDLEQIAWHVIGADAAYLKRIGWKFTEDQEADLAGELGRIRAAINAGLAASARGELPAHGPRGGAYWTPRYFARRSGWHVLDHAWEIEDRLQ